MTVRSVRTRLSRRGLLGAFGAGAGVVAASGSGVDDVSPAGALRTGLFGEHQVGIASPPLRHLSIAGFDVTVPDRAGLVQTLRTWTGVAAELVTRDRTVTVGFGPTLFADPRFDLERQRPDPLVPLPTFAGEALDARAGGGDLCVQVCAGTPEAAHHGIRRMTAATRSAVIPRWRQIGFRGGDSATDPRGLFGFADGTANLDVRDARATRRHLWICDGPEWARGGTYLVVRRIRLLLDTWDRVRVDEQERVIGRHRAGGARTGRPASHVGLARAASNGGVTLLRRSYWYDAGLDPNGLLDAGLVFICFQRDPRRQFTPIQQALSSSDPLNAYSQHVASGLFVCPPGPSAGSWFGAELFA